MIQKFFSVVFIVFLLPFLIFTYLVLLFTLLESPIFIQKRLGQSKKEFNIYKFKSMKNGKITQLGKIIRKLGIDEFPQLINILKGDMNFVGPRPLTVFDVNRLEWNGAEHEIRWSVKPGLTGKAQLANVCDKNISWEQDQLYIATKSNWNDMKIIMQSILIPIIGKAKQTKTT